VTKDAATPRSRFLACAGYEIHVMEWGAVDAPALIMWHGLARTGRDFDELAGALSAEYRIVCPDTIGRGMSQWAKNREQDYNFETYSKIAADLLNQLNISKFDWVGTSMGGALGMTLAAGDFRGRLRRLVLNDIGPQVPPGAVERISTYAGNPPAFDTVSEVGAYLRMIYTPFGENPESFWQRMTETSYRRLENGQVTLHYDPMIVTQFTNHRSDLDIWDRYEAVDCPMLLLRGADSDVLTPEVADDMVARNANCRLETIAGYGHAPTLNREDQIGLIRDFLAG
jgi:pimeloyl-ACP methyl ester carboxylesterase